MCGCRRYARVIASAGAVLIAFGTLTVTSTTVKAETEGRIPSAGDADEANGDEEAMIAEAVEHQHKFVAAFNARKWDDVGAHYAEDAIAVPPNHEPIQGRAAIVEYWKSVRDTVGVAQCGEPIEGTVSGNLVAIVGRSCTAHSGQLGFTYHELSERQADGSLRYKFDMFGFR
jgi:ketosteroid isomerase-like protein